MTDNIKNQNQNTERQPVGKIVFVKTINNNNSDYTVDAINNYICNLDSCRELKYVDYFYIDNDNEFNVTDKIFGRALKNEEGKNNEITSYTLEIYSYELKLSELKKFIEDIKNTYIFEQNNKLGNQRYYFDERHVSLMLNRDKSYRFSMANHELMFNMTPFNTNKSLENVYGSHLDVVKERMKLFINNPDWYKDKGIPYTLGILLHGPPGTGKTSLIKAIAKDTDRHIFNIKLQPDTTQTQLNNLFFNENVCVVKKGQNNMYTIPINKRIYVIEDIDCNNDILLQREYQKKEDKKPKVNSFENSFEYRYQNNSNLYDNFAPFQNQNQNNYNKCFNENINSNNDIPKEQLGPEEDQSEKVTLSFILNLLDGILETPGRILIITSNYPDKLDKALIRPGRIDINLEVGYCNIKMITEMFNNFYKLSENDAKSFSHIKKIKNITPAKLNKILLDNFNNFENAYIEILTEIQLTK